VVELCEKFSRFSRCSRSGVRDIRLRTRRKLSPGEKIHIVLEGLGGASTASKKTLRPPARTLINRDGTLRIDLRRRLDRESFTILRLLCRGTQLRGDGSLAVVGGGSVASEYNAASGDASAYRCREESWVGPGWLRAPHPTQASSTKLLTSLDSAWVPALSAMIRNSQSGS